MGLHPKHLKIWGTIVHNVINRPCDFFLIILIFSYKIALSSVDLDDRGDIRGVVVVVVVCVWYLYSSFTLFQCFGYRSLQNYVSLLFFRSE